MGEGNSHFFDEGPYWDDWDNVARRLTIASQWLPEQILTFFGELGGLTKGAEPPLELETKTLLEWGQAVAAAANRLPANTSPHERLLSVRDSCFLDVGLRPVIGSKESHFTPAGLWRDRTADTVLAGLVLQLLGKPLGVQISLLTCPHFHISKWCTDSECAFFDLLDGGREIDETELLTLANNHCRSFGDQSPDGVAAFEALSNTGLIKAHLNRLAELYRQERRLKSLNCILSIKLLLDPTNVEKLVERALLRRDLGLASEALADIKRVFSFVDRLQVPDELRRAYLELQTLVLAPHLENETRH